MKITTKIKARSLDLLGTLVAVAAPLVPIIINGDLLVAKEATTSLSAWGGLAVAVSIPSIMLLFRNSKFKFSSVAMFAVVLALGFLSIKVGQMLIYIGGAGLAGGTFQQLLMAASDSLAAHDANKSIAEMTVKKLTEQQNETKVKPVAKLENEKAR